MNWTRLPAGALVPSKRLPAGPVPIAIGSYRDPAQAGLCEGEPAQAGNSFGREKMEEGCDLESDTDIKLRIPGLLFSARRKGFYKSNEIFVCAQSGILPDYYPSSVAFLFVDN
jgi:hypothetical protein